MPKVISFIDGYTGVRPTAANVVTVTNHRNWNRETNSLDPEVPAIFVPDENGVYRRPRWIGTTPDAQEMHLIPRYRTRTVEE